MHLTAFQSGKGDSLLLTNAAGTTRVLVDGGMPDAYNTHIAPVLGKLRVAKRKLDLVYISHIDEDHIGGILEMLDDEVAWRVHEHQIAHDNPTLYHAMACAYACRPRCTTPTASSRPSCDGRSRLLLRRRRRLGRLLTALPVREGPRRTRARRARGAGHGWSRAAAATGPKSEDPPPAAPRSIRARSCRAPTAWSGSGRRRGRASADRAQ